MPMTTSIPSRRVGGELDVASMADNTITRAVASGSGLAVAVAKAEGRVYVFPDRCPHGRGRLSAGTLDGSVITCPMHGMRFDLPTGRPVGCRARSLRTIEVSIKPSTPDRPGLAARLARSGLWARFTSWADRSSTKVV
jgi:3-phenylpropionate/trans-cinnamate dioxygenase ferredoxin subunit